MEQIFKIGDLVKPTRFYQLERKHTSSQCKLGVVIGFKPEWASWQSGGGLYKVYWWPHNSYFFFPVESLELVSRTAIDSKTCSLEDLVAELQNKAEVV